MDDKIKIFASDDNLKALGELLSNETSRKILSHLMKNEMYINEISTKLDIRANLVIHHLKKMESLGLLVITNKKIIKKGEKHRFFKFDADIFVTLNNTKKDVDEKGTLKTIFKDTVKFASIFILGLTPSVFQLFANTQSSSNIDNDGNLISSGSIIFGLFIIITGLIIERIFTHKKIKKGLI